MRSRLHLLCAFLIIWQANSAYAGDHSLSGGAASRDPIVSVNSPDSNYAKQASSSRHAEGGENSSGTESSGNDDAAAPFPLTAEDLIYGESQVARMILDRPLMSKAVKKGDPVWTWAARQFAGEYTGSRFAWADSPLGAYKSVPLYSDSCFMYPYWGMPGWITVNRFMLGGWPDTGERMWSVAIFELFNCRDWQPLRDAASLASTGAISKDEYIHTMTLHEYMALQQRLVFYNTVWRSSHSSMANDSELSAMQLGCRTPSKHPLGSFLKPQDDPWWSRLPATYEKWFNSYPKDSTYLSNYSRYYDECTEWRRTQLDKMMHDLPQQYGDFTKPSGESIRAGDIM